MVDDEEPICAVVATILEDEGYEVETAVDGEALAIADRHLPDLVILDIMMPLMDGPEVHQRLQANPRTAHIPVVVMTAAGDAAVWARQLGAVGSISKPFDMHHLIAVVASAMESRERS